MTVNCSGRRVGDLQYWQLTAFVVSITANLFQAVHCRSAFGVVDISRNL